MRNIRNKKKKLELVTRLFSWGMCLIVTLSFSLGLLPLGLSKITQNGSVKLEDIASKAKADSLTSYYDDSTGITSTTNTSTYTTKVSVSGLTSGTKYFFYTTMGLTHSSATGDVDYRILFNSTTLYSGDIQPCETTYNHSTQIDWMDVYTPPANGTLYVQFRAGSSGTATAANAVLMGMSLDSRLIENYDYYFAEDATPNQTHASSGFASHATFTMNNADGQKDWLIFGSEHVEVNSTSINHQARLRIGGSYPMTRSMEGEDTADDYSFVLYTSWNDIARGTVVAMQVGDDSTGVNQHTASRLFAINLQCFRDRATWYADINTNMATYTSWSTLRSTSYSASSTGSTIMFGGYINDANGTEAKSNFRLTTDGTTRPSGWQWHDGAGNGGKITYDTSDQTSNNVPAVATLSAGTRTIVIQGQEMVSDAQYADEVTLTVFSAEFNYMPRVNNWRWYADEGDETPGTAYADINAEPNQEEVGLGIGMKLRINFDELGGLALPNTNRKKMYYSTADDGSVAWTAVDETDESGAAWRFYNGAGTDSASLTVVTSPSALTGTTEAGNYNESNDSSNAHDHSADGVAEFEYCIQNISATADTTYYFAFFDENVGLIPPASGKSFPSITTASAYDLSISMDASNVDLGTFQIGSGTYHEYDFDTGEEITVRDNRGVDGGGDSSGWTLSAAITTEMKATAAAGGCSAVSFTGSGLDDMTIFDCSDNQVSSEEDYTITVIDTPGRGMPDLCEWTNSTYGGGIIFTQDIQLIAPNILVFFASYDGHTVGDYWEFTAFPDTYYTIEDGDMYWITNSPDGIYDAPTDNISTESGDYMGSAVTAAEVTGSGTDGLGGFEFLPTLRIYNISNVGTYLNGVLQLTLVSG